MKSTTKTSAISKLELLQTQVSEPQSNNESIFLKSNLKTDDGEMIEDKNVQIGGQNSVSSSDEEIEQFGIKVGKSQKAFSIWPIHKKSEPN